jgi:hypothetical protein
MPNDAEPLDPQSDEPTHGALFDELKLARRHGLSNPSWPLPNLLFIARILSAERQDADKLKDAITKAIARLGGNDSEALMALMGFTDETRHLSVGERRKKATKLAGHQSREVFRTTTERSLLRSVATQLSVLVAEQRMADQREADQADRPPVTPPPAGIEQPAPPASGMGFLNRWRAASVALSVLVTAGLIMLIAALATRPNHGASARTCGSTTAQLFAPPASSESPSDIYIYAPHQEGAREGWADPLPAYVTETKRKEVFRLGETRLFAISYNNTSAQSEQNIIARVAVPQGAMLIPNSACLYRRGDYSSGKRYDVSPLLSQAGLTIGSVASSESVYLTFRERLPTATPSLNFVRLYGRVGPEADLAEPEWTREHPYLELELTS